MRNVATLIIVLFALGLTPNGLAEKPRGNSFGAQDIYAVGHIGIGLGTIIVHDRDSARYERIAHDQIDAQREADRNRTAVEVYRESARSGCNGTANARNGQVGADLRCAESTRPTAPDFEKARNPW